mgnify:FL=1
MVRFSPIAHSLRLQARKKRPLESDDDAQRRSTPPEKDAESLAIAQRHTQFLVWQLSDSNLAQTREELDTLCREARVQPAFVTSEVRRAAAHASSDSSRALLDQFLRHPTWSAANVAESTTSPSHTLANTATVTANAMFHSLQGTWLSVPSDVNGTVLFDKLSEHIAESATVDVSQSHMAQFLVSLLRDEDPNQPPVLDRSQRVQLVARLCDTFQDTVAQALSSVVPQLPFKPLGEQLLDLGEKPITADNLGLLIKHCAFTEPSNADVSALLGQLLSASTLRLATNFALLPQALAAYKSTLDWQAIVRGLDELDPLVLVPSDQLGVALCDWIHGTPNPRTTFSALWGVWTHRSRQLQILYSLLLSNATHFSMKDVTERQIVVPSDFQDAPGPVQMQAQAASESVWNSLDLIETLMDLASSASGVEDSAEVGRPVTAILERAIQMNAECVLLGLVLLPSTTNVVHTELVTKLLAMFLAGHPAHQLVFRHLWRTQPVLLMDAFKRLYVESPLHMTRIVDVAQELGMVSHLVSQRPLAFALDAAALAARRDVLPLESWLEELISSTAPDAQPITATLDYLDSKIREDLLRRDPQAEPTFVPLHVQQVATILRVLRGFGDAMTPKEIEHFKIARNMCLQLHPRLMTLTPGPNAPEPGLSVTTFTKDVHREADSWYRQMYEEKVSVDDIIALLRRCKHSDDTHEQQLFACMVHTLFDEHRWFELYYPPRELLMTAVVFGALIQYRLIEAIPLGIAIRYVVDALESPPESTFFHFGLQALLRFQKRLPEWPQFCQVLLSLPTLTQSHPEMIATVNQALIAAKSGKIPPAEDAVFPAIEPDGLPADSQRKPDESESDKLLFLINNMSLANVDEKLASAREVVVPEILHWLARYLVLERVSLEPNNHDLYLVFLRGLEQPRVFKYTLHETLAKLKNLLEAEKTMQSTSERTILKNLASWLGLTTLAQQRPILHRQIAFKDLLLQGYEAGRLIVAIPFVCKVLEHCANSRVFQPPNP